MALKRTRRAEGWGRSTGSTATWVTAHDTVEVIEAVVAADRRGVVGRGAGCSYNDAAQNGGGTLVVQPHEAIHLDPDTGRATASAGTTIGQVLAHLVPRGRFVPVTPGTRQATIGGCVAADVHGKNHHVDGSWGQHVTAIELVDGHGDRRRLTPDAEPEEFHATVGGMGLSGIIRSVTFDTMSLGRPAGRGPIGSGRMAVSTTRTTDFDHTVATLGAVEADHRYAVAWIDATATGRRSGRGVVSAGNHLDADEVPAYRPPREVTVPAAFGRGPALVTPAGIRMFNELWYRKAPKRAVDVPTSIAAFFHPLDGVAAWNRLYGRRGFVQYQSVVPEADQVRAQLRLLTERGAPSAVTVLKRFGAGNPAMLSFPTPGWTLAVDIPATVPDLRATLDDLDRQVVAAGGRIYLAKDGRSRAADLAAMYPRLDEWRRIVDKLDPEHRFQSDLSRRLGIRGEN